MILDDFDEELDIIIGQSNAGGARDGGQRERKEKPFKRQRKNEGEEEERRNGEKEKAIAVRRKK